MTYWKRLIYLTLLLAVCMIPLSQVLAQPDARVGVFKPYEAAPDVRVEVPIEIKGVQDLYAIDVELTFDPTILTAEDADPDVMGIQPGLGIFLDAGMSLYNEVDLQAGKVRFVMTQINPSEPKSGDGVIIVVYFKGIATGESLLTVTSLTLSDRMGMEIPAEAVDSKITIITGAQTINATSIPVQNPTSMIIIPTMAPSPTPTNTPEATLTPIPTATPKAAVGAQEPSNATQMPAGNDANGTEVSEKSAFQQYWWVLLLVTLLVAALAVYLIISKRKGNQD